ncbi:hypothetical protein BMB171_C4726 [Bacillus thuringiensis BMB171]|nr:hypothetical protein BMB171_C4726 [Bacillus thuringiensis BMB171]
MTNLRVTHLTFWKTYCLATSCKRCVREFVPVTIKIRFLSLCYSIPVSFFTKSETVKND